MAIPGLRDVTGGMGALAVRGRAVASGVVPPRGDFCEVRLQEVLEHVQETQELAEVRLVLLVGIKSCGNGS